MTDTITIVLVDDLTCPNCGAGEVHPTKPDKVLIRGHKVGDEHGWWSQCLVCSGFYDKDLNEFPDKHDRQKGWFCT